MGRVVGLLDGLDGWMPYWHDGCVGRCTGGRRQQAAQDTLPRRQACSELIPCCAMSAAAPAFLLLPPS